MSEDQPTESLTGAAGSQAGGERAANGAAESAQPSANPQARVAELEARLAQAERELASEREAATDYMQRWQRAQADFANLKRRAQQEQDQLQRLAAARALAGILPAIDSFERAFATLPPTLRQFTWIDGIGLVHLQLHGALQAAGMHAFAPDRGAAYDPHREQAIGDVETRDAAPGTVAVVVQQGYLLGDMVLRPALVQLARAPQANPTAEAPPSEPQQAREQAREQARAESAPEREAESGAGPGGT